MATERKSHKSFPSILSKLKALNTNSNNSVSMDSREDGIRSRTEPRITPRLAWVARKESTTSAASTCVPPSQGQGQGQGGSVDIPPGGKSSSLLSRMNSLMSMSLGGTSTAWGKRLKKKRDAEEYAAQKLERQKREMINFYRGTPMTDDRATSNEILRFLYEMWEPQLCSSYRPDVKITTTCRQDLRSARRIVQTTPRRVARLHRARLVFESRPGSSSNIATDSVPNSGRSAPLSRPISAKSVT